MPTLTKQIGNPRGAISHVVILRKHNFLVSDFSLCTCSVFDDSLFHNRQAFSPFDLLSVVGVGVGDYTRAYPFSV